MVVYDRNSQQLSLRDASHSNALDLANCPTCHRPFRDETTTTSEEEHIPRSSTEEGYVTPGYFRMLGQSTTDSAEPSHNSSPHRKITQPLPNEDPERRSAPRGAEFVGSAPAPQTSAHGISSSAFIPNYFKTFFVEEKELGRGGKGVVLLVRHVLDGVFLGHYACKRVPVGDDHDWLEKVLIEVQYLQKLSHQNLVSYRHVWLENHQVTKFGPSVPCAFILQQYCNAGDLQNYITGNAKSTLSNEIKKERLRRRSKGSVDIRGKGCPRKLQFEEIFSFFKDITSGLSHLHSNNFIHRDLKPSNCLLHQDGPKLRLLVSDFGEVQTADTTRKSSGATGTISYCAPEVLRPDGSTGALGNFSTKSDIFSLGMIVYFMCFGRLPYTNADGIDEENEDLDHLRQEIAEWAGFNDESKARTDLPDQLYKFLKRLLSIDPAERPGTEDILQSIKGDAMLDEVGDFAASTVFADMGPRISRIDSPAPTSATLGASKALRPHPIARPAPSSKLRATVESPRSPSPPKSPQKRPAPSSSATGAGASTGTSIPENVAESSVVLRHRALSAHPSPSSSPSPPRPPHEQPSPRLALPPPPTLSARLHMLAHDPAVARLAKLAFFLAKALTASAPCAPFAARAWIAVPLLLLAALDLASLGLDPWGRSVGLRDSAAMFAVHLALVRAAAWWDVLCVKAAWEGL